MCYKLLGVFIQYFEGMYLLFSASTHWLTEYLAYTTFRMMITQSGQNLQFESLIAFEVGLSMLNLNVFLIPFVTHSTASFIRYFVNFPANQDFLSDDLPVKIKAVFFITTTGVSSPVAKSISSCDKIHQIYHHSSSDILLFTHIWAQKTYAILFALF